MRGKNKEGHALSSESVDQSTVPGHEALTQAISAFDKLISEFGEITTLDIWQEITELAPSKIKEIPKSAHSRGRPKGSRTISSIREDLLILNIKRNLFHKIALSPTETALKALDRDVVKATLKQKRIEAGPSATSADIQAADTIRRRYSRLKKELATIQDKK